MEFIKHLKNIYNINSEEKRKICLMCGGLLPAEILPQKSEGIVFNNDLMLSIQGSFGHYCFPRKTLPYNQYKSMEFALCDEQGFVNVKKYLNTDKYDTYFDGSVYGYVPIELIEKLYQALKSKYGLKR